MIVSHLFSILFIFVASSCSLTNSEKVSNKTIPLIVATWDYKIAVDEAWKVLNSEKRSVLDAIEEGINACEEDGCRMTVGFGGHPDENGETTLDAMIMDGVTMDTGAVAGLRRIGKAISVARKVLEHTAHSLLAGDLATEFAVKMGFPEENSQTPASRDAWLEWKANKCQPNYWKNVSPDPKQHCGPFEPLNVKAANFPETANECHPESRKNGLLDSKEQCGDDQPTSVMKESQSQAESSSHLDESNGHDTIGMIAIDVFGHIAAGTSTNGFIGKIPGRVGDSPIAGSGCYADQEVGAAAATGDGDVLARFLPSFHAVEEMRRGASPATAVKAAIDRIIQHYPESFGAVIAINKEGEYAAACGRGRSNGFPDGFPFYVINPSLGVPTLTVLTCHV